MFSLRQHNAKSWWNAVDEHLEAFLEASATLNSSTSPEDLKSLLAKMQSAYEAIERRAYPTTATTARQHLLEAMQGMLIGFRMALSGNMADASATLDRAYGYLETFNTELHTLIA